MSMYVIPTPVAYYEKNAGEPMAFNHDRIVVERYSLPINQPKGVQELQALMSRAITDYAAVYNTKPAGKDIQVEVQEHEGQRHLVLSFEHRKVLR